MKCMSCGLYLKIYTCSGLDPKAPLASNSCTCPVSQPITAAGSPCMVTIVSSDCDAYTPLAQYRLDRYSSRTWITCKDGVDSYCNEAAVGQLHQETTTGVLLDNIACDAVSV